MSTKTLMLRLAQQGSEARRRVRLEAWAREHPGAIFGYHHAMAGKAVIVHSLGHARAALAAAAGLELPVTLASAPGAAGTVGPAWFQQVVAQARADFPGVAVSAVIDCADQPGHVLAALRQGLERARFTGEPAVAAKLSAIAAQYGAELVTGELPTLDLRGEPRPEQACRDWLAKPR